MARGKVLVVDDDELTLEVAKARLERMGYDVEVRDKALGTLRWISDNEPDFVLLDVMMPALSGDELAILLRRRQLHNKIGVIFYSSRPQAELDSLVRRTGMLGAIRKGTNDGAFLRQFITLVDRFRARAAANGS